MEKMLKVENSITIDSREVAEMMEMKHYQILEKLEGTKTIKGIVPILSAHNIMVADYFIKSIYVDAQGKERPCYKLTKMGCEFMGNKLTGEKGVLFTAKYVSKFNKMEQVIYREPKIQNFNDKLEHLKLEEEGFKLLVDILKPSQASTIKMLGDFNKSQGLSTSYLPVYTDEKVGKSATELLKKFDADISTIKFNQLMLENEFLKENTRKSTNKEGFKKYKSLTEKGLYYGKNLVCSKGSEKETQPLYYEDTFQKLLNIITK